MTSERLAGLFLSPSVGVPKGPVKEEKNHRPTFLKVYRNNLAQPFLGLISVIEKYDEETEEGEGGKSEECCPGRRVVGCSLRGSRDGRARNEWSGG